MFNKSKQEKEEKADNAPSMLNKIRESKIFKKSDAKDPEPQTDPVGLSNIPGTPVPPVFRESKFQRSFKRLKSKKTNSVSDIPGLPTLEVTTTQKTLIFNILLILI